MPTYEYLCESCGEAFEVLMLMSKHSEVGKDMECPKCGTKPARQLISGGAGFILKGDGWTGKDLKINQQMTEKNRRLDARQTERKREGPSVTLIPNVGGERTESWSDAAKLAQSQGKDPSGYESHARSEKKVG